MYVYRLVLSIASFSFLVACNQPQNDSFVSHISDKNVRSILKNAIETAGGWESYNAIDSIVYVKRSVLYEEDGTVESDVTQTHRYQLSPNIIGEITWEDSLGAHLIHYDGSQSYKSIDGRNVPNSTEQAQSSFMSAYYVLFIPFKLLDDGVQLSYLGQENLESGELCDVIKATYSPSEHENHSTADEWYYYFEKDTGRYMASMVYHAPTYAYITNDSTTQESNFVFNTYRKSYRVDQDRNIQFLRGEFWYSDYTLIEN